MSKKVLYRRLTDVIAMFLVTALSLLLLVYVGFAEGKRIYEQFHIEKLTSQGRIIQNAIENYLRVGLPLHQYAGFSSLAEPIVQIKEIDAIRIYDATGRELFSVTDRSILKLPEPSPLVREQRDDVATDIGATHYQLILPLRTRFETAGSIVVFAGKAIVEQRLDSSFRILAYGAFGVSAAFALFVLGCAPYLWKSRAPWLQIGYAVLFLTMAGVVVTTLIELYSDGVQGKVSFSAESLAQRLSDVVEFRLRFRDFDGLDKTFSEYRRLNPEISEASLIIDEIVQISTDPAKIGKARVTDPRMYEYKINLTDADLGKRVLAVAAPKALVYERVERSVRNFGVLFVASGFLAGLFLQVATSMQRLRSSDGSEEPTFTRVLSNETALIIVKPIFFLAVFLEHLMYSFLPGYMQHAAVQSGMSVGFATAPFTAYYLCFALTLIPAGYAVDRRGPKALICWGLLIASIGVFSLLLPWNIVSLMALRGLAGVGQAMLFIGIQSYILAVAAPEKKTQGAGIIVFGFQGGMIAGMAIGSLLVVYLQPYGVFILSGAIGIATALYSILLIPKDAARPPESAGLNAAVRRVASDLGRVMRNAEFMRTMFCIGVPAKAILTGAVTFALPLLLAQQGYRQEEVGQIIMLYGIGVVGASLYAARLVDRTGSTETVLFWGASISGMGLVLVGLVGSATVGDGMVSTMVVVLGIVVVGIAHGCINAPVVTHVAHSQLAREIGQHPVTAAYRFLERGGHIAGPLLVGQAFLLWGQSPHILAWIGFLTTALGFVFLISAAPPERSRLRPGHAK